MRHHSNEGIPVKNLKKITLASALVIAAAAVVGLTSQSTSAQDRMMSKGDAPRLGTIDINAVFESYPGRAEFDKQMQQIQQDFMAAQQSGDQQAMMQLQQKAQQMQETLQTDFQSDMEAAAPSVAKSNNVKILVSDVIYQADAVKEVDLTQTLVEAMSENGE